MGKYAGGYWSKLGLGLGPGLGLGLALGLALGLGFGSISAPGGAQSGRKSAAAAKGGLQRSQYHARCVRTQSEVRRWRPKSCRVQPRSGPCR